MAKSGFAVIVAGPDLAKAMPKMFKQGASYVVASADVLNLTGVTTVRAGKPSRTAKMVSKPVKASRPAKVMKPSKAPKPARASTTSGKDYSDVILKFVKQNPGTNMTAIEASTKLPQADIRRTLNSAREAGVIRTKGQRRGLTYYAAGASSSTAPASAPVTASAEPAKE